MSGIQQSPVQTNVTKQDLAEQHANHGDDDGECPSATQQADEHHTGDKGRDAFARQWDDNPAGCGNGSTQQDQREDQSGALFLGSPHELGRRNPSEGESAQLDSQPEPSR